MILAEGALQLVNAAFVLVLPLYMENVGYTDFEVAGFIKYRFAGVLLLAFPFGLFLKGRAIKPFFYISAIALPILSFAILEAVEQRADTALMILKGLWGISFMLFQVSALPFILRNARKDTHTEAISLSFGTWSLATIIGGILIAGLQKGWPDIFDEKTVMQVICGLAATAPFLLLMMRKREHVPALTPSMKLNQFDWNLVLKALIPTLLIAVGAGMTIPFISLFFKIIFGVDSAGFSLIATGATVLVFATIIFVPNIKRKWGFQRAIPVTQGLAILMLVGLASTEFYSAWALALPAAILFYVFRQPLMNIAGPMTSEFTMNYVGKRNEEIMSALNASVWSGSWFFSGWFFQVMREAGVRYAYVFLITAALYSLAVVAYIFLLRDAARRQAAK